MTHRQMIAGLTAAMTLASGAGAYAQNYPGYQNQAEDYRWRQDAYRDRVEDYQNRTDAYRDRTDDYRMQRDDYERQQYEYQQQQQAYEQARRDYDARYGPGAFDRNQTGGRYQPPPPPPPRGAVNDFAYPDACRSRSNNRAVAGGVIGAIAGAALGSNLAARNARPEGTVLGAVVGGALGAGIGKNTANCDGDGYYFSYAQTYEYREPSWQQGARSGRYDYGYYLGRGCRLAIAPAELAGRTDYRYVRVCPDRRGRYRITD